MPRLLNDDNGFQTRCTSAPAPNSLGFVAAISQSIKQDRDGLQLADDERGRMDAVCKWVAGRKCNYFLLILL